MSFRLPTADHAAREMMDIASVAEILNPANLAKMATLPSAIAQGKRTIAESNGAIKRVVIICIAAQSDERWLISVGSRGGWRKEWNFGTGRD